MLIYFKSLSQVFYMIAALLKFCSTCNYVHTVMQTNYKPHTVPSLMCLTELSSNAMGEVAEAKVCVNIFVFTVFTTK